MRTMRTIGITAAVATALLAPALAAGPASAAPQSGRPGVQASGSCSVAGTWKLTAKADDGQLEVEFEVDTNVAGQAFNVRVTDGKTVVFAGRQTTTAPSGSFSLERRTADHAGRDTITAIARRAGTNVCTGTVRI
jgi:hypothetical protein